MKSRRSAKSLAHIAFVYEALMKQHVFFTLSVIAEGTTEKVLEYKLPTKFILRQKLCVLANKKVFGKVKTLNLLENYIILF